MSKRLNREVLDPTRVGVLDSLMNNIRRYKYSTQEYRPVFIAGTTGGGTTVLAMLLRQNLLTAGLVAESALQLPSRSALRVQPIKSYQSISDYRKAIEVPINYSVENARKDILNMYRNHTRHKYKNIIDKGPNVNLVRAGFLQQCFPESLFILLIRDPVACIEGMRRKWPLFGNASLDQVIDFYEDIHTQFLESAEKFCLKTIYVTYEELVRDSKYTLENICSLGNLTQGFTESYFEERANQPGQGVRNVKKGRVKIIQGADQKSYDRLDPNDIEKIQSRLEPLRDAMSILNK